jgi:hypothetical protein
VSVHKPCPWCKGTRTWVWDKAVPGAFAIACSNPHCAATGPISRHSVEHAEELWDSRGPTNPRLQRTLDEMHAPEAIREA